MASGGTGDVGQSLIDLHESLKKRSGNPATIRLQAQRLLSRSARTVADTMLSRPELLRALPALVKGAVLPHAVLIAITQGIEKMLADGSSVALHSSATAADLLRLSLVLPFTDQQQQAQMNAPDVAVPCLTPQSFDVALDAARKTPGGQVDTQTVATLLEAMHAMDRLMNGKRHPIAEMVVPGSFGLLPSRGRKETEGNLSRCRNSREVLGMAVATANGGGKFDHVDAMTMVQVMGATGLPHSELLTRCAEALQRYSAVNGRPLPPVVAADVLFHFGSFNHRHEIAKELATSTNVGQLPTTRHVAHFLQGAAMLRLGSQLNKNQAADGIMRHALRGGAIAADPGAFVDIAHSLDHLTIGKHHKLLLSVARHTLPKMSDLNERHLMKLLFTYSDIPEVPVDLQDNWTNICGDVVPRVVRRCETIEGLRPIEAATMAMALKAHNVTEHRWVMKPGAEPGDALRNLWSQTSVGSKNNASGDDSSSAAAAPAVQGPNVEDEMQAAPPSSSLADLFTAAEHRPYLMKNAAAVGARLLSELPQLPASEAAATLRGIVVNNTKQRYGGLHATALVSRIAAEVDLLSTSELAAMVEASQKLGLESHEFFNDRLYERHQ